MTELVGAFIPRYSNNKDLPSTAAFEIYAIQPHAKETYDSFSLCQNNTQNKSIINTAIKHNPEHKSAEFLHKPAATNSVQRVVDVSKSVPVEIKSKTVDSLKRATSSVFTSSKPAAVSKSVSAPTPKTTTETKVKVVAKTKTVVAKLISDDDEMTVDDKPVEPMKRKRIVEDSPETKRQKEALVGMFDDEEEEQAVPVVVASIVITAPVETETRRVRKTRKVVSQVTTKDGKYIKTEDVVSYESYSEEEIVKPVEPKRAFAKAEPKKLSKKESDLKKKGGKQQTSLLSYFQKK